MTRRRDFMEAFWIDPDYQGLAGWPSDAQEQASENVGEAKAPPLHDPVEAVIAIRDRIGFRYERIVGLADYVSQREAAQVLGLPVMTITRWVRRKKLARRKRRGYTVVLLRDVLQLAKEHGRSLKMRSRLHIREGDRTERTWIPTREG